MATELVRGDIHAGSRTQGGVEEHHADAFIFERIPEAVQFELIRHGEDLTCTFGAEGRGAKKVPHGLSYIKKKRGSQMCVLYSILIPRDANVRHSRRDSSYEDEGCFE